MPRLRLRVGPLATNAGRSTRGRSLPSRREFKTLIHNTIAAAGSWLPKVRAVTILLSAFCLPALLARPAAAQITGQLTMHSETGDWVGQGQDYYYDSTGASFSAQASDRTGDGLADYVTISLHTPGYSHWWYLTFATNQLGTNLAPGSYPDAQRAPFAGAGHPGLDVSGDGRGSNTLTGNFTIQEAVFDYSGGARRLVRFSASFEQHSEGFVPALFGTVQFVDNTDTAAPTTTASLGGFAGVNGWYRGPVQVALAAVDAGVSGVAATWYGLDQGAPQQYSTPFAISGDGSHSLTYWSVDRAGNQEAPRDLALKIDGTVPSVTAAATVQMVRTARGWVASTAVTGRITDATAGVDPAGATYAVTDEYGLLQPGGAVVVQADGSYAFTLALDPASNSDKDGRTYWITVQARDLAGNAGSGAVAVTVFRR